VKCPKCGWHMRRERQIIDPEDRSARQSRTFHKLCSSYSRESGQSAEDVKVTMKYAHGIWWPHPFPGETPSWPGKYETMFKNAPNEFEVFMKSEAAYTKHEEMVLIEGAKVECFDIGADIEWMAELEQRRT